MGIQAAPDIKFALIRETAMQEGNLLQIDKLCEMAGVSRSGYYSWCAREPLRQARHQADLRDFRLIQEAYAYRGYEKTVQGIHMRLLHMGILMNVKKIRRLMQKFDFSSSLKKGTSHRRVVKTVSAESNLSPESPPYPRSVYLADISCISYCGGADKCYLSAVFDCCTHEILAYQVSPRLSTEFLGKTLDFLLGSTKGTLDDRTVIHGFHGQSYTSATFVRALQDAQFVELLSQEDHVWDYAAQESFFGYMKDEILSMIEGCESYHHVLSLVNDWVDYYNTERGQWSLCKLTPNEYYEYTQTGVYPLPVYQKASIGEKAVYSYG